ncbi:MAG: diaminopimelate epimerase [Candidatus Nomurabacteria bacterium]|nr:diaminopimelate epimerase [Candidatus Nomurabacteria bacterium]
MNIEFTKMHGLGNDFIVINNMNGRIKLSTEQVVFLCNRFIGVGADGVILVEKSDKAHCFMNYINADGTYAEMCGNGVRCTAKFLRDDFFKDQNDFKIDTRAGIKEVKYYSKDKTFSVNMGKPIFKHSDFPENSLDLEGLSLDFVSVGNPHAVAFVENLNNYNISFIGPRIENDKHFPNKINFHIVQKKSEKEFDVLTWERGCGATLACGTGACAVYAILRKYKNTSTPLIIGLPGGKLFISENEEGVIIMSGPAESVFSAIISL